MQLTSRRSILIGLPLLVLSAGVAGAAWMMHVPSDLDLSRKRPSVAGHYIAALAPEHEPVALGTLHAWIVTVTDPAGAPVTDARLTIDGGMPQHGHGLPTAPAVTRQLGAGRYLVEGVKFNMSGWWELKLGIDAPAGPDSVTFNILL